MQRFYLTAPGVSVTDSRGEIISNVAVYDTDLLYNYLVTAKLSGLKAPVEKLKRIIYQFLDYWNEGERKITISCGFIHITTYPVSQIDYETGMTHLGTRPVDPKAEVLSAMSKLSSALRHRSPNAAALYQELQNTIQKHPSLQIKESV